MLRDSVEQVWLAGLGALAVTENEGTRLFKNLVKQGEGFEKATRERLDKAVKRARAVPGQTMTAVEEGLDETMVRVLHRLGVPTRREINSLTRRVEGLTTTLEQRGRPARTTSHARTTSPARATSRPGTATRRRKVATRKAAQSS
jgi:poly(hydroxyalkanoate) granule-associated protein